MTILTWNVRGWGKEGRRVDVHDIISKEKVDMCGLVETKVEQSNCVLLNEVSQEIGNGLAMLRLVNATG